MHALPVCLCIGASRGIGRQIAIDLARNGYTVVVSAKTTSDASKCSPFPPNPNSPQSTINTVAREITEAGGTALAIAVDVRYAESIDELVAKLIDVYGRLDVVVYNSGAIWWSSVEHTPVKRYRLMQQVNSEGLYATIQASLPHLYKNSVKGIGRIIVVSPPIYSRFFRGKTAYAMSKVACSVLTQGLAMDFLREGRSDMAVTSIWPAAAIESAATQHNSVDRSQLRRPTIFSDAILALLTTSASKVNGRCVLDEDFLRETGVTDFSRYVLIAGSEPRRIMPAVLPDLTVAEQDDEGDRMDSNESKFAKL
ncbi:hypothetical protein AMS68_003108 [Peltaster fructicola]|uniref:Uncharacterized protein n=1 Tax=Peltaster fructicola TaxID=286661 RepID=A0A6H0XSF6_9PEZI|nr:hypothetical protein AMS68_003108 [Peltaster fructicola]